MRMCVEQERGRGARARKYSASEEAEEHGHTLEVSAKEWSAQEAEIARLRAQVAALEAAAAPSKPAVTPNCFEADQPFLVKLISKRLMRAEATIGELRRQQLVVDESGPLISSRSTPRAVWIES